MTVSEIRKLSTAELASKSTELRSEIATLRQRFALGETPNVRAIRNKRKELARMLTVLSEQLAKETK